MVTKSIIIRNPEGLHCRPAAVLVEETAKFSSEVIICFRKERINAKSILSILTAGIACGSEISVECSGEDEQEALDAIIRLIESEFKVA